MNTTGKPALLVIDMQNDFVLPGAPLRVAGALETVPAIQRILAWFRENGLPVLHVVRAYRPDGADVEITRRERFRETGGFLVRGTAGWEIVEPLRPRPGEPLIVKPRFSGFWETELASRLKALAVGRLALTGTQLPYCVRSTALDGVSLGYPVAVLRDGCSSQTRDIHGANLRDLENAGIPCPATEAFIRTSVPPFE